MQLGFIDFICMPVYKHLAEHLPSLKPMVDNVIINRANWEGLQGRYDGFSSCSLISHDAKEALRAASEETRPSPPESTPETGPSVAPDKEEHVRRSLHSPRNSVVHNSAPLPVALSKHVAFQRESQNQVIGRAATAVCH